MRVAFSAFISERAVHERKILSLLDNNIIQNFHNEICVYDIFIKM